MDILFEEIMQQEAGRLRVEVTKQFLLLKRQFTLYGKIRKFEFAVFHIEGGTTSCYYCRIIVLV